MKTYLTAGRGLSGPQMVLLGIPTLTDIIQSQKYKKLSQQSVCSNLKPDPFAHRDYIHEVTATLTKNSMIQKQYILLAAMWLSQACFDYVYVSRIKRRVSSMNLFYCVHPPMLVSHTANTKILPWHDSQQCLQISFSKWVIILDIFADFQMYFLTLWTPKRKHYWFKLYSRKGRHLKNWVSHTKAI